MLGVLPLRNIDVFEAYWLVANRHLPYEGALKELFSGFDLKAQEHGYKVYEART